MHSNGRITFQAAITGWNTHYFPVDGQGIISPFETDIRPGYDYDDRIYSRQTSDDVDILNRGTQDVRDHGCEEFTAQWVFIATWYRVTHFGGGVNGDVSIK